MHLIVPSPKGADLRAPFFSSDFRFLGHFWGHYLRKIPHRTLCKGFQWRGRDSAGRRPSLSRCRPRGSLRPCNSPRPDGRSCCFGMPRPVSKLPVRCIPKQPGALALGCCRLRRGRDCVLTIHILSFYFTTNQLVNLLLIVLFH